MGRRNPAPISGTFQEVASASAACVLVSWVGLIVSTTCTLGSTGARPSGWPVPWVVLTVGTSPILGSTSACPAGWSAAKARLAISFTPSRRLRNVLLQFGSALPAVLFSSRRYGCICSIRRRSPCGIGSSLPYRSSSFTLLIFSFRPSASAVGASRC